MNVQVDKIEAPVETIGFLTAVDDLAAALQSETKLQTLLNRVEEQAKALAPDVSSATGRAAITSNAYRVTRSRTAIEAAAKDLTEGWRTSTARVNAVRKAAVDRLDALRDEVRKPLDDWERAEDARKANLQEKLASLRLIDTRSMTSAEIQAELDRVAAIRPDSGWAEVEETAIAMKQAATADLGRALDTARTHEAEQAELARFRAEAEERRKAEAASAALMRRLDELRPAAVGNMPSARIQAEFDRIAAITVDAAWGEFEQTALTLKTAALATLQASLVTTQAREAEAERIRLEAEEKARREADERIAQAAREKAEREAAARIAEAERAAQEAEARAQAAAAAERKRIADEAEAADAARLAREADQALRAKARATIVKALMGIMNLAGGKELREMAAVDVADAIIKGIVPHVEFRP